MNRLIQGIQLSDLEKNDPSCPGLGLPKHLEQLPGETDSAHARRVKNHLLNMSAAEFSGLGYSIDPHDPDQKRFYLLYNEITTIRANRL